MITSFLHNLRNQTWLAFFLCLLPVIIYIWIFQSIALNVNYVAFDDILVLGVIPGFWEASWLEKWQRLTELFPEHRLVFSRSIILILVKIFGKISLVWLMVIGNICWAACAFLFYKIFKKLQVSIWYFVPVMWTWFNIQSFENIFWGVSSLCNFGVLLLVISSFYQAIYHPKHIAGSLLLAVAGTFTYGNGLMIFPIIGLICLLTGRKTHFLITLGTAVLIAIIYFIDFTPITQNLDFSDPGEVKEGLLGFFGFIGSIATLSAYAFVPGMFLLAVATGMLMILLLVFLFRKEWKNLWTAIWTKNPYTNKGALFGLSLAIFIGITSLALVYKRIPTDAFEGMFKGRYRMYSTLACIAIYFSFLSLGAKTVKRNFGPFILIAAIGLNFLILHTNFADAVDNRRQAVVQEFNARYNADWLGVKMFSMDQARYEKIRGYYQSADPLAEGWNPRLFSDKITCDSTYLPDSIFVRGYNIVVSYDNDFFKAEKDYTDGAYVLMKSQNHVYASSPNQIAVPLKTTLRRQMYFAKGASASFHRETVEPGTYDFYLLIRKNGVNKIYCTGKTWKED